MSVYEVPRPEWSEFCSRISGQVDTNVTIDALDAGAHDGAGQRLVSSSPLTQLSMAGTGRLLVSVAEPSRVIEIQDPARIEFAQHGEDAPASMVVRTESGQKLILSMEDPVVPGIMDGLP